MPVTQALRGGVTASAQFKAMKAYRITVTAAPTLICKGVGQRLTRWLVNNAGPGSIFLGDSVVTAVTGFQLAPGDPALPVTMWHEDELWGIRPTAGNTVVHVLVGE